MNLHEHSSSTHWERGIKCSKQDELEIYNDIVKELKYLLSSSKPHTLKKKPQETKHNKFSPISSQKSVFNPLKIIDSLIYGLRDANPCDYCRFDTGYFNRW
jgi:hypothetical protein